MAGGPMRRVAGWATVVVLCSGVAATVAHPRGEPAAVTIAPLTIVREAADPAAGVAELAAAEQAAFDAAAKAAEEARVAEEARKARTAAQKAAQQALRASRGGGRSSCSVSNDEARATIAGREGANHVNKEHPGESSASGKYGFVDGTWGGHAGVKEAWMASEAEQDARFDQVWANGAGASHWNASGGCPR